jgi:hypothetical protein
MKKNNLKIKSGIRGISIAALAAVLAMNPFDSQAQQAVDGHNCNAGLTGAEWSASTAIVDPPDPSNINGSSDLLKFWGVTNGTSVNFAIERKSKGNALFAFYLDTDCDSTTGYKLDNANGADYAIITDVRTGNLRDSTIYEWNSTTSIWDATTKKANAKLGEALCTDNTTDERFLEFSVKMADIFDVCGTTNGGSCGVVRVTAINTHAGADYSSAVKDYFITNTIVGTNLPPVGDFGTLDTVTCGGEIIYLNALTSLDGNENLGVDDSIATFEWDTDYDGVTFTADKTGSGSTVFYTTNGTRTLALRVTDAYGCTDIHDLQIDIFNAPVADATLTYVVSPITPCEIVFADGSSSVDNFAPNDLIYSWDFGDGSTSTQDTVTHTYAGCNTYNVMFSVTDPLTVPKCATDTILWTIALPVELVDFKLFILGYNTVQLIWATASEHNNSGWEIQRSLDGVNWTKVGFTQGAGNSQTLKEYMWMDPSPVLVTTSYYRLKQLDNNGEFTYTIAKKADFSKVNNNDLQLYPNPVTQELTVKIEGVNEDFLGEVVVFNQQGQVIKGYTITNNAGITTIDVSNLSAGIYFVKTVVNGKESRQQFIKK